MGKGRLYTPHPKIRLPGLLHDGALHKRSAEGVGWPLHDGAGGKRKLFGFAALGEWGGGKLAGRWGESGIFSEISASGGMHNRANPRKLL